MDNKFRKFANQEDDPNISVEAKPAEAAPGIVNFEIEEAAASASIVDPRMLGKCLVCCYRKHNPLFTLGPHCKLGV